MGKSLPKFYLPDWKNHLPRASSNQICQPLIKLMVFWFVINDHNMIWITVTRCCIWGIRCGWKGRTGLQCIHEGSFRTNEWVSQDKSQKGKLTMTQKGFLRGGREIGRYTGIVTSLAEQFLCNLKIILKMIGNTSPASKNSLSENQT